MNLNPIVETLFYHIYPGPFLARVLERHLDIFLKYNQVGLRKIKVNSFFRTSADQRLVQKFIHELQNHYIVDCDMVQLSEGKHYNELSTISKLSKASAKEDSGKWIAYAHTKGVSRKDEPVWDFSCLLLETLFVVIRNINRFPNFRHYYNAAGAFCSLAFMFRYRPLSIAFAGNFWVADSAYLCELQSFEAGQNNPWYRHDAEGYIGQKSETLRCFNSLSITTNLYDLKIHAIDVQKSFALIDNYFENENCWNPTNQLFDMQVSYLSCLYNSSMNLRRRNYLRVIENSFKGRKFLMRSRIANGIFHRALSDKLYLSRPILLQSHPSLSGIAPLSEI